MICERMADRIELQSWLDAAVSLIFFNLLKKKKTGRDFQTL